MMLSVFYLIGIVFLGHSDIHAPAENWRPAVHVIGDNLAINLTWNSHHTLSKPVNQYHIQFRSRSQFVKRWSKPHTFTDERIDGNMETPFSYITNKQPGGLEAGLLYQFRVIIEFQNGAKEKSAWSSKTSFAYILPVAPLVTVAERLVDGKIMIKWTISRMRVDFPVDAFVILFRKEKRLPSGETGYSGFRFVIVNGNLEESVVDGLDSRAGYQFVVYGVHTPERTEPVDTIFTGGMNGRQITAFSQEVFVPADPAKVAIDAALCAPQHPPITTSSARGVLEMNSSSSNSLMFIILGVLAGFMLLVMLSLVAVCFYRQHREKIRSLTHVNTSCNNVRIVTKNSQKERNHHFGSLSQNRLGFLLSDLTPIAVANFRTANNFTSVEDLFTVTGLFSNDRDANEYINSQSASTVDGGRALSTAVCSISEINPRTQLLFKPFSVDPSTHSESRTSPGSEHICDMAREPPCGGSINDENDNDETEFEFKSNSHIDPTHIFCTQTALSVLDLAVSTQDPNAFSASTKRYSYLNNISSHLLLNSVDCMEREFTLYPRICTSKRSSDNNFTLTSRGKTTPFSSMEFQKPSLSKMHHRPRFRGTDLLKFSYPNRHRRSPLPHRLQAIVPHEETEDHKWENEVQPVNDCTPLDGELNVSTIGSSFVKNPVDFTRPSTFRTFNGYDDSPDVSHTMCQSSYRCLLQHLLAGYPYPDFDVQAEHETALNPKKLSRYSGTSSLDPLPY